MDGYQNRIVLRGCAWIDETYVSDTDLSKGYGQARKRGLSKQRLCIAVGIDARKEPVAVVCGHGKPSTARIRKAMKGHVAKGATLVHDRERARNALVRELDLEDESHKADVRDPEYLEALELVNNPYSWIKRCLRRFTDMDPANLQSYLNLYVYLFRVKRNDERWPKIARVVRHLLTAEARFRSSTLRNVEDSSPKFLTVRFSIIKIRHLSIHFCLGDSGSPIINNLSIFHATPSTAQARLIYTGNERQCRSIEHPIQ